MFYTEGISHNLHPERVKSQRNVSVQAYGLDLLVDRYDKEIEFEMEYGSVWVDMDDWKRLTAFLLWLQLEFVGAEYKKLVGG